MSTAPDNPRRSNGSNFVKTSHNDTYPLIDPKKQDLSSAHVLITGASKGVGRATASSYARAGASAIALVARSGLSSVVQEIRDAANSAGRLEPKILALSPVDISDKDSVQEAVDHIRHEFDHIDILINNAGTLETWKPLAESDPDVWWNTWKINILGTYLVTRAIIPLMRASKSPSEGGRRTIITVSSAGQHRTLPGASAYQTTKLALARLMEFVNIEESESGIVGYVLHPGGVSTELASAMPEYMLSILSETVEIGADTMVYLTSERREWLAGRYLDVTWDMTEFMQMRKEIEEKDLLKVRMAV
ncbi:MAG: hypothetical protein M1831_006716 [Alyxoria varia]|nr:MAG: hypothetical protein M1831_006716 [Alyxoria varia]